jgi:hypothetical protein
VPLGLVCAMIGPSRYIACSSAQRGALPMDYFDDYFDALVLLVQGAAGRAQAVISGGHRGTRLRDRIGA